MNFSFFKSAVVSFFLGAGLACASNLLTYSATSNVSQKDADQKALEGVAKQMSTRIKSEFETHKVQDASGKVTTSADLFKGSYTNVVLKGAKIVPGEKNGKLFTSTVTVDLDQIASKILLDLDAIRSEMKSKDSVIRLDMVDRNYRKVSVDMVALGKLADRYNAELENLSCVQKVPAELKLESTLKELREFLIADFSSVRLETDLTSEALIVTVTDYVGPVVGMPIALVQDRKNLASEKTDNEGNAIFSLKDVMAKKPVGEVTVRPEMNFEFVYPSSLASKTVQYSAEKRDCAYRFVCNGGQAECGALRKFMLESGFSFVDDRNKPELVAALSFSDKANSAKTLVTSKATVSLKSGDVELVELPQGVGRDNEAAHIKAVTKLPASKILQTFVNKSCKK